MRHLHLAIVPAFFGTAAAALVAFVKFHGGQIMFRAAMAAVSEFAKTRDADMAATAALREGMRAASMHLVRNFFRLRFS